VEIETAIRNKLIANAALAALVGQRIYYVGKVSQDVAMPYVTLQVISKITLHSHQGNSHLTTARIQINSFDDSYLGCKAVDAAIFAALDSFVGTASGLYIGSCLQDETGDFENDDNPDISGVHTDYMIQWND
jgi:hypothetical protein